MFGPPVECVPVLVHRSQGGLLGLAADAWAIEDREAGFGVYCDIEDFERALRMRIAMSRLETEVDGPVRVGMDPEPCARDLARSWQRLLRQIEWWKTDRTAARATRHSPGRLGKTDLINFVNRSW